MTSLVCFGGVYFPYKGEASDTPQRARVRSQASACSSWGDAAFSGALAMSLSDLSVKLSARFGITSI